MACQKSEGADFMIKKLSAIGAVGALAVAFAAPAANADQPLHKCNSGRGNGSELVGPNPHHLVDCDPGNSGGHNNGGD
jgi:hypothetical protein